MFYNIISFLITNKKNIKKKIRIEAIHRVLIYYCYTKDEKKETFVEC